MNTRITERPSTLFNRVLSALRPRPRNVLDGRYMSDHFRRDIGLLDGRPSLR
ncbi:MAG: hypothetical protein ACT6RL_16230 [Neoaquamicrobium sediminum]|jgi:hypothetical protein|uniref:hypothetical protein n=1 Tax=Neoaquamicrobium sediminum TaxID=1849104 RepID=UPI0040357BE6